MKHDTLGELEFSSTRHGWYTTTEFEIDFFRRAGLRLPKDPDGGSGRGGRVDVGFAVEGDGDYELYDGRRRQKPPKPTKVQLAAWQALSDAGDRLWSDLSRALFAEYQRQRPARLRWWQAAFAHYKVDFVLPEVQDEAALLGLVHPHSILVKAHEPDADQTEVGVGLAATWIENGISAVIRDGRFVGLGDGGLWYVQQAGVEREQPGVGRLTRKAAAKPWQGVLRCETFSRFMMVADERAAFRRTGKPFSGEEPACFLSWHAARGEFPLWIHAPEGHAPTARQSEAITRFNQDIEAHATAVLGAVRDHYRKRWKAFRNAYDGQDRDIAVPEPPATPNGFADLMELRDVHVFPDGGGKRPVTIGLQFKCTWDTDTFGFGVLWRNGKVVKVCAEDDAGMW